LSVRDAQTPDDAGQIVYGKLLLFACRFVKLAPEVDNMLKQANLYGINCMSSPSQPTFGLLLRLENDTWMAGVGGSNNIHPGRKDEELLEFAEQVCDHY